MDDYLSNLVNSVAMLNRKNQFDKAALHKKDVKSYSLELNNLIIK